MQELPLCQLAGSLADNAVENQIKIYENV